MRVNIYDVYENTHALGIGAGADLQQITLEHTISCNTLQHTATY